MKITIVPAPGLGDALIFQVAAHNLALHGFDVQFLSPHRFGSFFPKLKYTTTIEDCDAILLQHDNRAFSKEIHALAKPVYTFYGAHKVEKHGPLREGFDYVCDLDQPIVANVSDALKQLFGVKVSSDIGIEPPPRFKHRKQTKRVVLHTTSGEASKNWHKFEAVAKWLEAQGYEPTTLPLFSTLEELMGFIYESGFLIGNDSGPGHIASALAIPHLIIGKEERQMRHWRPGWHAGEVVTPPSWAPRNYWKHFVTTNSVIDRLKSLIEIK